MKEISPKHKGQELPIQLQCFVIMIYSNQRATPHVSSSFFPGLLLHFPFSNKQDIDKF
jgi:hypothetical protein